MDNKIAGHIESVMKIDPELGEYKSRLTYLIESKKMLESNQKQEAYDLQKSIDSLNHKRAILEEKRKQLRADNILKLQEYNSEINKINHKINLRKKIIYHECLESSKKQTN
jgi:hypothetical protein